jgi:hypothetical protein
MLMESATYGTGKQQNYTRSGRLMTVCVLECCGTRMNLVSLLLLAGMVSLSTGIKSVLLCDNCHSGHEEQSSFMTLYSAGMINLTEISVV